MDTLRYFVVNAFTSRPFSGNPATVVLVPQKFLGDADSDSFVVYFQKLAGEVSNVETAFVLPPDQQKTDYRLRFFTKSKETSFCGHATIAAAHILSTEFNFPSDHIYFSTRSGVVVVKCSNRKHFELDLHPTLPALLSNAPPASMSPAASTTLVTPPDLTSALWSNLAPALFKIKTTGSSSTTYPSPRSIVYHESSQNLIIIFDSVKPVTSMAPDSLQLMDVLAKHLSHVAVQKVTVTGTPKLADSSAAEDDEQRWRRYDFVTRLFAPWIGIPEDAVSGATHAILAQFWRTVPSVAGIALKNKRNLICYQPSTRGGEILLTINGDRVGVAGEAVTISTGSVSSALSRL